MFCKILRYYIILFFTIYDIIIHIMLIDSKRRYFMNKKTLKKKIILQKITLNLLLKFLSPQNRFVIYISQSLDKHIWQYQYFIYKKYKRKHSNKCYISKSKAAWHEKNTSKIEVFFSNLLPTCRLLKYSHLQLAGGFCSICFCHLLILWSPTSTNMLQIP